MVRIFGWGEVCQQQPSERVGVRARACERARARAAKGICAGPCLQKTPTSGTAHTQTTPGEMENPNEISKRHNKTERAVATLHRVEPLQHAVQQPVTLRACAAERRAIAVRREPHWIRRLTRLRLRPGWSRRSATA